MGTIFLTQSLAKPSANLEGELQGVARVMVSATALLAVKQEIQLFELATAS